MLAKILHEIYAYQIFQSVFFRASMGFLTSYFLTSILMPPFIAYMYKKEYVSDLPIFEQKKSLQQLHQYRFFRRDTD